MPDGLEPRVGFHPGAGKAAAVGQFTPAPQTLLPPCSCAPTPARFIFAHGRGAAAASERQNRVGFNVALSATPGITFLL